jgi:DNA-binding IscR family transcriptional regulator
MEGLRCLQQLGLAHDHLTAAAIARAEGLDPQATTELLETLRAAGLVEGDPETPGFYRLSRGPKEIRLADVWAALSPEPGKQPLGGPTLQHVLDWEDRIFTSVEPAEAL